MDKVVISLLEAPQFPHLAPGRLKVMGEYPLPQLSWLQVKGSQAGGTADWSRVIPSPFGIELPGHKNPADYERSFNEIREALKSQLKGMQRVYTHNPWGEYGHEEHIQVHRAVESLKDELGFELWFNNYASQHSMPFMLEHLAGFKAPYESGRTNPALTLQVKALFQKHGCWTWYDDWEPFHEECFMNLADLPGPSPKGSGHIFPINLIRQER